MIDSVNSSPIDLCWRALDDKKKMLDFHFTKDKADADEKADVELLDGISDDLDLIKSEIDKISKMLLNKLTRSKDVHSADVASAAGGQTNMVVLKTLAIMAICFAQFKIVKNHFEDNKSKRPSIDPFANNNMIWFWQKLMW